ncbi:hypothetical protein JXA85_08595 [Candidatus Woesearchaeota archaeon]|nr:hypothetical protein [Candidatus Woesearchaeota archaeon]
MVGNISNYTKADILRCFFLVSENVSRDELVRKLDIGEGTVRTLLDILKGKSLVSSTKQGHFLTEKGASLLIKIKENIEFPREFKTKKLFPNYKKVALLVRKHGPIKSVVATRDVAVKNGAEGALILVYEDRLKFPDGKITMETPDLEEVYDFKNKDILIVTFGSSLRWCEVAAISVAFELNGFLKQNIFK